MSYRKPLQVQLLLALWLFCTSMVFGAVDIADYGAVEGESNWKTAKRNSEALVSAVSDVQSSDDPIVLIPKGTVYYLANCTFESISNVLIQIDGNVIFSDDIRKYPSDIKKSAFLFFWDSHSISIAGYGMLDGQGLLWWRAAYLGHDNRPNMLEFQESTGISIEQVKLFNSPAWSVNFVDCANVLIHDITIFIDSEVTRLGNRTSVTYALNTDGIDIAAENVTVYNTNITNYDDAIVVKPCRSSWKYCQCAGNILAYNNMITYSTGLTIGSVPPSQDNNCIKNVVFRDSYMNRPLKALYIKSNPGSSGTGLIEDIIYQNIVIHAALWWTIWVGPQQQNQPNDGSEGTGCNFLFPFVPDCPTQPLVTIRRVSFIDIFAIDTVPIFEGPGVFLCDPSNPCTDFVFSNVTNSMYTGNFTDLIPLLPVTVPGVVFPTQYRDDDWEFQYISSNMYAREYVGQVQPSICVEEKCFWTPPPT